MTKLWPSRIVVLLLWLLLAGSATYWILKFAGTPPSPMTANVVGADAPGVDMASLARVLGPVTASAVQLESPAVAPVADPAARMQLLGVVANRRQIGVALIALDGQAPRPYRVGSALEGGYKLTSVAIRSATLASSEPGGGTITLELPTPGNAAAGVAASGSNRLPQWRPPGAAKPGPTGPGTPATQSAAPTNVPPGAPPPVPVSAPSPEATVHD